MALVMVHLLVAQRWTKEHPQYAEDADFYLGAISPDAIHIRDHDDKSHKNYVHLNNWTVLHPEDVLAYWREHHTPFDIGYGIHVLTDALWVKARLEKLPQMNLPDGGIHKRLYYQETFLTDFALYHEDGGRLFEIMAKGKAPENHPYLTQEEFVCWQHDVIQTYQGECPKKGTAQYITCAYAHGFVEACQETLNRIYGRYENE